MLKREKLRFILVIHDDKDTIIVRAVRLLDGRKNTATSLGGQNHNST